VLIVVAVIAVLLAMLLPAVQSFRAAARRTDCGNNLKQLAIGIQGFHARNGSLPTAWGPYPLYATLNDTGARRSSNSPMFGSWLAHILPDIDMEAEYMRLPKAKVALGMKQKNHAPGVFSPVVSGPQANFDDPSDALDLSRNDGVSFNVHSYQTGSYRGGGPSATPSLPANGTVTNSATGVVTVTTTSPSGDVIQTITTPSKTITEDVFESYVSGTFWANGISYVTVKKRKTGTRTRTVPASTVTIVVGNRPAAAAAAAAAAGSYNTNWGSGGKSDRIFAYFNYEGISPATEIDRGKPTERTRGYPFAQSTIRVPITVCKGDNSDIETTRTDSWLGGHAWPTTNYMINPFAFGWAGNEQGPKIVGDPSPSSDAINPPDSVGQYRLVLPGIPNQGTDLYYDGGLGSPQDNKAFGSRVSAVAKRFDDINDGQSNTILITESMRMCSTAVIASGEGADAVPTFIKTARLAFWSSPALGNIVDLTTPPSSLTSLASPVVLAIQPHPSAMSPTANAITPSEVAWKPYTHNFGVEWESQGKSGLFFANTYMFQTQPKLNECSSFRAQSNHGNLLMVAMCDGSVKPIQSTISRREKTDSDLIGKAVGGEPDMGKFGDANGTWDQLMRDNDGVPVSGY
jgi:hypothetical protein